MDRFTEDRLRATYGVGRLDEGKKADDKAARDDRQDKRDGKNKPKLSMDSNGYEITGGDEKMAKKTKSADAAEAKAGNSDRAAKKAKDKREQEQKHFKKLREAIAEATQALEILENAQEDESE